MDDGNHPLVMVCVIEFLSSFASNPKIGSLLSLEYGIPVHIITDPWDKTKRYQTKGKSKYQTQVTRQDDIKRM